MSEDAQEIQENFVKESVRAETVAGDRALLPAGHIPSRVCFFSPETTGSALQSAQVLFIYTHSSSKAFPLSASHCVLLHSPPSLELRPYFPKEQTQLPPSLRADPLLKLADRLPFQGPP